MEIAEALKIEDAIQQKRFKNEFHKAQVNLLYTAAYINQQSTQALKPYNISIQQFNILRILRGLHPEPATVKLLTERMIDKMSNASRLVEKLKKKGLLERKNCIEDRRRVNISITQKGLDLLVEASDALEAASLAQMEYLNDKEAELLNDFLDRVRTEE
ncbi:MAG TPA: MarR family transcriptional regulator [Saprospiraceae bacterium]|nr:MarR family transcriptional regulator [Saprospiraceae bacterium]